MRSLTFYVLGVPAPKGSSRAIIRGGRPTNVPSGSNVNRDAQLSWGNAVRAAAVSTISAIRGPASNEAGLFFPDCPLRIKIVFRMRRLKAHFRKDGTVKPDAPKYHTSKPDLGKILRSTEDAMTGIVYLDDSRLAEVLIRKPFADPGREGAWICIEQLEEIPR